MIQSQTGRQFLLSHLRQIFSVVPNFFLHHWESRQGQYELVIQIPENLNQIVSSRDEGVEASPIAGRLPMNSTMIRTRTKVLRGKLLARIYSDFERFKDHTGHLTGSSQEFDVFLTKRWPLAFDLNNPSMVPDLPLGNLKEQPHQAKKVSVQEFIKVHDQSQKIREAVRDEAQKENRHSNMVSSNERQSQILSDSSADARRRALKPGMQTGIKESTLAVVRMKDQMDAEAKVRNRDYHVKQEQLKNIETI